MIKVKITPSLLTKLDILSSEYNIEIGGYLLGEIKDGILVISDLLIPSQRINSVAVEISPRDQIDLLKRYRAEKCKRIVGHWHSHHTMGCFWSGQDKLNMNQIMTYKDYFLFIVSSKKNHLCRLCLSKPIRADFENADLEISSLTIDMLRSHVNKIIENNQGNPYSDNYKEEQENKKQEGEEDDDSTGGSYYG